MGKFYRELIVLLKSAGFSLINRKDRKDAKSRERKNFFHQRRLQSASKPKQSPVPKRAQDFLMNCIFPAHCSLSTLTSYVSLNNPLANTVVIRGRIFLPNF